jgi:predicted lipoprotein with Yx(FWY)xxD motif
MAQYQFTSRDVPWRSLRRVGAVVALAAAVAAPMVMAPVGASTTTKVVVKTLKTKSHGTILTTMKGFALYTLHTDSKNHSTCSGACASAWPILWVGKGVVPTGVTGLGSFKRSAGKYQVTFKGRPLYTFTGDSKGTTTGQGQNGFSLATTKAASHTSGTTTTSGGGYNY